MGLFEHINESAGPLSAAELANACNTQLNLTQRILRCLVAYGAASETPGGDEARYGPTTVSRTFGSPVGAAAMRFLFEFMGSGWVKVPQKLAANNYCSLTSATDTVFNQVYNKPVGATLWQILADTPYAAIGGTVMATWNAGHQNWLDFYPVQERLISNVKQDPDAVLMVDVGGFTGTQATDLRHRFKDTPGRVVVEDLPYTISALESRPEGVEFVAHDFFTPQPIKGARLYYLRNISHDWSDKAMIKLLSYLRDAMEPGYSKVIINDWILPERAAKTSPIMAAQDMNMMSFGGGEERTEKRHKDYIEAAGLVVTGIWDVYDGISEGIIECEVLV